MYDFHSPKQKTAIGNQETEPRHSNIIQIDQNLLETRLDRLITEKMAQILNAMPDASDRRDHRGRQIRAQRGAEGVQGRPLRTQAHRQGRQARGQGSKLKGAVFESAVIERYRRREQSVEESLIDMYLAGMDPHPQGTLSDAFHERERLQSGQRGRGGVPRPA